MKNAAYPLLLKTSICSVLVTAFAISLSPNLSAQTAPAKQWDKTFGGSNEDYLTSMKRTSDNGFILGGESGSGVGGDKSQALFGYRDYWILKTDSNGNKVWDKTFGGSDSDQLFIVEQTSDGGYILGGTSNSGTSGNKTESSKGGQDFWVIKLDSGGNKIWDKTLGGNKTDYLYTLIQTSDGGYLIGGYSASNISGDKSQANQGWYDYWIIKLNANGNKVWDKTFGGLESDQLRIVRQTSDGGFILGGSSNSDSSFHKSANSKGGLDFWIIKTDSLGTKQWDKTIGGSDSDGLVALEQTIDGGFILGGSTRSGISGDKSHPAKGEGDFWVIKLDSIGNILWDKTIGGNGMDYITALQNLTDGGYLLGGYSDTNINGDKSEPSKGGSDYWIIKIDANGNKVWDRSIGGNGGDYIRDLTQLPDASFLLAGFSHSNISGDKSQNSKGDSDYWIVKLGPEILSTSKTQPTFNLSISPNPNQGKFKLQLSNLTTSTTEVTITDLLGRIILQQQLPVTDNHLPEELEIKAANGMYLLTVQTGIETLTRKIVIE